MNLRQEIEHLTPALRRLARGLAGTGLPVTADICDDLVQETLLRALRFEKPVKGIAVRHWLYAILIGVFRQTNRSQLASELKGKGSVRTVTRHSGHEGRMRLPGDDSAQRASRDNPAQASHGHDIRLRLQSLDLEEREALALVVLEGLSYASAAAILGLPRPALVARLARARASLSQLAPGNARTLPGKPVHLQLVR